MFLGYQNNKIVLVKDTREELENTQCMTFDKIVETTVNYTLYNGDYLTDEQLAEKQKEAKKKELMSELDELDLKCIRALRAIQSGVGTDADRERLAELEEQTADLRQQLQELGE